VSFVGTLSVRKIWSQPASISAAFSGVC